MKMIPSTLKISCTAILGCSLLFVGCSPEARDDAGDTYEQAVETAQTMAEDTREWFASTWENVADYTGEQREAFVGNLANATETANERAATLYETGTEEAIEGYEIARDAMREQLDRAAEAGDEAWEETRANVREAWENLRNATEDLVRSDPSAEES